MAKRVFKEEGTLWQRSKVDFEESMLRGSKTSASQGVVRAGEHFGVPGPQGSWGQLTLLSLTLCGFPFPLTPG